LGQACPYRLVVDVGYESHVSGDERCVSGKPHTACKCDGGTSVACPVTSVAFLTKHGKPHQCFVSNNLHITNAEFVQHVWPCVVEESNAIWPAAKIELGKTH